MEIVKQVAEIFLLSLGLGTWIGWVLTPPEVTGAGFPRLVIAVATASIFLALIVHLTRYAIAFPWAYIFFILPAILLYFLQSDKTSMINFIIWIVGIVFSVQQLFLISTKGMVILLASCLLGAVNYAMLLGHYHLVVPKLSEKYLLRIVRAIFIFLFLKIVFCSWTIFSHYSFFISGTMEGAGYLFNWVIFSMRTLWGLVVVTIFNIYTWKLVKIRSIQSATGILYAMLFFVLAGELIGLYFLQQYGVPL